MMRTTKTVTSFVLDRGNATAAAATAAGSGKKDHRLLILRRSQGVRTMRGLWAGVSGTIEGDEDPLDRARIEILEEVGLAQDVITLVRAAAPTRVTSPRHPGREWLVFPFLFEAANPRVRLNWENSEFRWIRPGDLGRYRTVPDLGRVLSLLLLDG